MAANSISNFSSIHLIPSSGQRIAIQQKIENNKHEIAKTQKEVAEKRIKSQEKKNQDLYKT